MSRNERRRPQRFPGQVGDVRIERVGVKLVAEVRARPARTTARSGSNRTARGSSGGRAGAGAPAASLCRPGNRVARRRAVRSDPNHGTHSFSSPPTEMNSTSAPSHCCNSAHATAGATLAPSGKSADSRARTTSSGGRYPRMATCRRPPARRSGVEERGRRLRQRHVHQVAGEPVDAVAHAVGGEVLAGHCQPQRVRVDGRHAGDAGEGGRVAAGAAAEVADGGVGREPLRAVAGDRLAGRLLERVAGEVHPIGAAELGPRPGPQDHRLDGGAGQFGRELFAEAVERREERGVGRAQVSSGGLGGLGGG